MEEKLQNLTRSEGQADIQEQIVVNVLSDEGDKVQKQRRLLQQLKARKRKNSTLSSPQHSESPLIKVERVKEGSSFSSNISYKDCDTVRVSHTSVDHNYSSTVNESPNVDRQTETHKRQSSGNSSSRLITEDMAAQLDKQLANPVGDSVLNFILNHLNSVDHIVPTIVDNNNKNSIATSPAVEVQSGDNHQHDSNEITTTINDDEALLDSLTTATIVVPQTSKDKISYAFDFVPQSSTFSIIDVDPEELEHHNKNGFENESSANNNSSTTSSLLTHDSSKSNRGKRFSNLRYFSSKGYRTVSAMLKSWESTLKSVSTLPNKNWFHHLTASQTQDQILNIYELESKFSGGLSISRSIQIYPQGAFAVSIDSKLCTDSFVTDRGIQSFNDLMTLVLKVSRHKLCKGCEGFENIPVVHPAIEGIREGDKWYSAHCLKTIEISESSSSRCPMCEEFIIVLQKLEKSGNNRNVRFEPNGRSSNRQNYVFEQGKLDLGKTIYSLVGDVYRDLKLDEHAKMFRALPANAKR